MAERQHDSLGLMPVALSPGIPLWFVRAWHEGIISLCRLPLDRRPLTPQAEMEMAEAFAETAWPDRRWDEARDRSRIAVAFSLAARGHRIRTYDGGRFPNIDDLLFVLPKSEAEKPPEASLTKERLAAAQEAKRRAFALLTERPALDGQSQFQQIAVVNALLRRHGLPEFRAAEDVRRHQIRQACAGDAIAAIKLR
jgi:hypothetical protein